jgi:hypothetical protein
VIVVRRGKDVFVSRFFNPLRTKGSILGRSDGRGLSAMLGLQGKDLEAKDHE